jgi:hypothetical protein
MVPGDNLSDCDRILSQLVFTTFMFLTGGITGVGWPCWSAKRPSVLLGPGIFAQPEPPGRVAHSIPPIFLLDEAARGEDTTCVIHRGVIRRGCPTLSERKGGRFFSDAEKP